MIKIDYDKLINEGYCEFFCNYEEFLQVGNRLGTIISSRIKGNLVDNLIPKEQTEAHPNSLSRIYGLNDFPFHNDGAYFEIPPRYIILRYVKGIKNPTPTIILPIIKFLDQTLIEQLKEEVWVVIGRSYNFYSSVISNTILQNELVFRFDLGCMKPSKKHFAVTEIINQLSTSKNLLEINWEINKTLIIDNWKLLHTRPKIKIGEKNFRTLQRIMINV